MKRCLFLLLWAAVFHSCQEETPELKCVKAQYVGEPGTPCAGPHLIKVLEGAEKVYELMPELYRDRDLVISTALPAAFAKPGKVFYFQPEPVKDPQICLAIHLMISEIKAVNVSETGCP